MTRRLNWPVPVWLPGAVLLLAVLLKLPETAWERNRTMVHLIQDLDQQGSQIDSGDRLYLKPGLSLAEFTAIQGDPCQSLWQSRLAASFSLTEAQQLADDANSCPRALLVERWQGQLDWLIGERDMAMAKWKALPPSYLARWGRNLSLAGSVKLGKAVLQTAEAQNPDQTLDPSLQVLFYQTLGDLARQENDLKNATTYYQQAWEASGYSYYTAYFLGLSYAAQEDCKDAIQVWEIGLRNKPERIFPIFDSSYLIVLGICYGQLGNNRQAQFHLDAAQEMIDSQRETIAPENIINQQKWLDRVRQSLR